MFKKRNFKHWDKPKKLGFRHLFAQKYNRRFACKLYSHNLFRLHSIPYSTYMCLLYMISIFSIIRIANPWNNTFLVIFDIKCSKSTLELELTYSHTMAHSMKELNMYVLTFVTEKRYQKYVLEQGCPTVTFSHQRASDGQRL